MYSSLVNVAEQQFIESVRIWDFELVIKAVYNQINEYIRDRSE